jgi:hypothetical protein
MIGVTLNPLIGNILANQRIDPAFRLGVAIATGQKPIASTASATTMEKHCNSNVSVTGTRVANHRGMKQRHNTMQTGRCYVIEYHGQNRATFECVREGHRFRGQLMLRAPNGKLPCEDMLRKMAHWWGRHNDDSKGGGVIMRCPKCSR